MADPTNVPIKRHVKIRAQANPYDPEFGLDGSWRRFFTVCFTLSFDNVMSTLAGRQIVQ